MSTSAGMVVMVTGAAGNLGAALARRFAADGARLVLVDRSAERLQALAAELIEAHGAETLTTSADLGDPAAVDALMAEVLAHYERLDVLAHTVGGYEAGATVADGDLALWERMFAINTRPVLVMGGRTARQMQAQGGGRIVFVLARSALQGTARHSAYAASKAAAQRVMESLSAEVRDSGVNVNAVMPSTIDTPPNRAAMPNADYSRWVTPQQVAAAIAFLCSADASALHGVSLEVYNRA
jgi:NAD(P)-dependent dehydrogenase (short-subunit alcohol dehydrogenase family)